MDAFGTAGSGNIDANYVDGISIVQKSAATSSRTHLGTFAMSLAEEFQSGDCCTCPCVQGPTAPGFVGNQYRCESGYQVATHQRFSGDALWDGFIGAVEASCSAENSGDPIVTNLPTTAPDDIEVRLMRDQDITNEDGVIESLEVYVR
jgi:hypothetical protein